MAEIFKNKPFKFAAAGILGGALLTGCAASSDAKSGTVPQSNPVSTSPDTHIARVNMDCPKPDPRLSPGSILLSKTAQFDKKKGITEIDISETGTSNVIVVESKNQPGYGKDVYVVPGMRSQIRKKGEVIVIKGRVQVSAGERKDDNQTLSIACTNSN